MFHAFSPYYPNKSQIAGALRSIDNKGAGDNLDDDGGLKDNEDTFSNVTEATGLGREDLVFAHATDSLHVDEHCPDFAVVVRHDLMQVSQDGFQSVSVLLQLFHFSNLV